MKSIKGVNLRPTTLFGHLWLILNYFCNLLQLWSLLSLFICRQTDIHVIKQTETEIRTDGQTNLFYNKQKHNRYTDR